MLFLKRKNDFDANTFYPDNQMEILSKKILFVYSAILSMALSCGKQTSEFIDVEYNQAGIEPDGFIDDREWNKFNLISNLRSPWKSEIQDHAEFKCFLSDFHFNFCFSITDTTLVMKEYTNELSVAEGDRAELFFAPSSDLDKYYCMEIDPQGNILDYAAQYYRKFDYSWNFNQCDVSTKLAPTGYIVEGRISVSELKTLGLDFNKGFYLGVFRADFFEENTDSVTWLSWVIPRAKEPDFHIPSAFGKCKLK